MAVNFVVRNTVGMAPNELKTLRLRRGLRQRQVAERLGVSEAQVSRWENGKNNIPSGQLADFAAAYECSIADIFAESDPAATIQLPSDETLAMILKAFAPALSAAQASEASIQAVAQELGVVLQTVGSNDEYERSPERLQGLLDRALVVIERSQRDKSQSG